MHITWTGRGAAAGVLLGLGGTVAGATAAGGHLGIALLLLAFYAVAALVAFLWSGGRGDVAAILRVQGDERQRSIDRDATAIAGLAMAGAAVGGAIYEAAVDAGPGGFGVIAAVGGLSYALAVALLRNRR
ncbi:MAG: hypothetical protein JO155_13720 [Acidimicrobiia bacterium]|nr:hypothetical protein [Acidimicrobiia bacterium]